MEKDGAVERLRRAIRIKTDWPGDIREDTENETPNAAGAIRAAEAPLTAFQNFLVHAYPGFHRVAERWVLSPYAVVYRWAGATGSNGALVLAHYDVVPVEAEKWGSDPFGAELKAGYIYGRGTQDMKGNLIGIMEAVEELVGRGFRPQRDIWFAFGGDEERSGRQGARNAATWLGRRGLGFSWILDEGSPVAINQIPGVDMPLALFGVEEKGFLSLELTVDQKSGHASQPPRVQAAATLSRALLRISRHPFPVRLNPTVAAFFSRLLQLRSHGISAKAGAGSLLVALGPLAAPLLAFLYRANSQIMAMLRTTVAMTQLEGSAADNVMPSRVRAVINLRLLPPWTVAEAINYVTWAVGDERVRINILGFASDPVPANPEHGRMRGPGWAEMANAAARVFPDAAVLPFIMTAATDSRHYQGIAGGTFRFSPMRLSPGDMSGVHSHNERISLENFFLAIRFYTVLFESL
ncbi:MAG: M20/M25/M40 family metallo-hydrolase [Treponema sp.]|jgi:carboxypeptidase PM20D1|nr:M20/M25/M40 family metallo-hydrolase [Treponema sp.]